MRYGLITRLIYIVIFFTGAAGLIYQVTWQRYLSRLLGSDSIATAIILAVFLGGLSTGYFLCGKVSLKVKNHFKAYALLEGIIGAWCLFFPQMFHFVIDLTKTWSFSPPFIIIIQGFTCSAILMGIPTLCMGSTIPFLTRGISRNITEATSVHARVYAINTAGAFLGTLVAGFFLIPKFGLPLTILCTAFMNLAACFIIYLAQSFLPKEISSTSTETTSKMEHTADFETPSRHFAPLLLYIIAFLSGFYVMTLENVLIRITNLSLGSSSYTFSIVIAVFILSIAIGSYFIANRKSLSNKILFFNQLGITLSLFFVYVTLDLWPYAAHIIRITFQSNIYGFWGYYIAVFFMIMLVLILPIGLMGATVPLVFHEIRRKLREVGKHSGYLFSCNTIGSLCGSLIGGIVLYIFFDNATIFLIATFLAAVSTTLAALNLSKHFLLLSLFITVISVAMIILTPFYEKTRFAFGTFRERKPINISGLNPSEFYKGKDESIEILSYKDGVTATVAVVEDKQKYPGKKLKGRSIFVNGKADSHTLGDERTLRLSAHLPALFSKNREDVMVVGLGTGVTAGELTLYPDIRHIDVAEISPMVVQALPYFSEFTYNLHKNPKVHIHKVDAFRFLGRSSKKYDIIISEPSNPWVNGVDQLFTMEYYMLVKEHLKTDGIFLQWLQIYDSNKSMVGMVFNTVQASFNFCHVFISAYGDLLIMGSMKEIDDIRVHQAVDNYNANEKVRLSLKQIGFENFDSILVREVFETAYLAEHYKGFGFQTLDNPRLHYIAGKCFFMGKFLPQEVLYNPETAKYFRNYLLPRLHRQWEDFSYEPDNLRKITDSLQNKIQPIYDSLKFKHLKKIKVDPSKLTKEELRDLDLLLMVSMYPEFNDWDNIPTKENSYKEKALLMLRHVNQYRNWIFPYSISGLETFLKEGISSGKDPNERNWCALRLISIYLDEHDNAEKGIEIYKKMEKDNNREIIIDSDNKKLTEIINKRLENKITKGKRKRLD